MADVEEDDAPEAPECRICRCTAEEAGEALYTPCVCKGSLEWVHPSCLEQWRQACPTTASRLRCDMCRTNFVLEQQRPGFAEICGPCSLSAVRSLGVVVLVELATVGCGLFVNSLAFLTGVPPEHYTFHPNFDLHLSGWTLLLPQAAIWTIVRKLRESHRALLEANPAFERGWWARQLFERLNAPCCALVVFTLVLVALIIPMGYIGKALIWLANHGWEGLDAAERERGAVAGLSEQGEVSWTLDPAHFYIASLVFCMSSFLAYLVMMTVLIARQHPDRLGCCKVLAALVVFEVCIMLGGYLVKILAVLTGVYGRADDDSAVNTSATAAASDGSGAGQLQSSAQRGWGAVEWSTDWNHHVLSLTAWMPVVHSVFFLQRFRVAFPRWKEAYPQAPCLGCLTTLLETWSAGRSSTFVAILSLVLIHAFGLGGKLFLAAITGTPMRAQAGRVEGENSGAAKAEDDSAMMVTASGGDDDDGVVAGMSADASERAIAEESRGGGAADSSDHVFVFGWGTDYTHYFIGFVLLYVCAGTCAGCFGLYARYQKIANSGASTVVGSPVPRDGASGEQGQGQDGTASAGAGGAGAQADDARP